MFSFLDATILTLERALLYLCSLSSLSSFPLCSLVLLQVSECSWHSRCAHQKKPRPTDNPHTANVLHQRLVFRWGFLASAAWSWSELQTTSQLWSLPPSLRQQLRRRWWWGVVRSSRKGGSSGLPDVHCRPHRPPPQPQWPPTCSPTHQSAQPVRQPTLSKCQQYILYLCSVHVE